MWISIMMQYERRPLARKKQNKNKNKKRQPKRLVLHAFPVFDDTLF